MNSVKYIMCLLAAVTLFSCKRGYEQIDFGKDGCAHCKMTIMDARYSAEIVDRKGKIFKFDDVACMKQFINESKLVENELLLFVADYSNLDNVIDGRKGIYLHSEKFSSPMNGNLAAFSSADEATSAQKEFQAEKYTWQTIR
jgi:copper chaperone NosL